MSICQPSLAIILATKSSDAEMTPYYQWFLVSGGNFPGTPLTGLVVNGTNVNLSTIPRNYTGDQIYRCGNDALLPVVLGQRRQFSRHAPDRACGQRHKCQSVNHPSQLYWRPNLQMRK